MKTPKSPSATRGMEQSKRKAGVKPAPSGGAPTPTQHDRRRRGKTMK